MIHIGVIGCGGRMRHLLKSLYALREDLKVTALFDPSKEAVQQCKGIVGEGVRVCDNLEEIVSDWEVDWIMIGSINKFHKEHIMAALDAGKHVFSEKPLALSVQECREIKKLYDSKNLKFVIGFTLRYSPHYRKIKDVIDSGKIGKIVSMEMNETLNLGHGGRMMTDWRRYTENSGGFLLEKCCHDIDIANWFAGDLPKKVSSFGGLNFFNAKNSDMFDQLRKKENFSEFRWKENPFTIEKDVVDNQILILEYIKGAHVSFHTNFASAIPERRVYICGTKGTLRADVLSGKLEFAEFDSEKVENLSVYFEGGGHGGGDEILVNELYEVMADRRILNFGLKESISSVITCFYADQARCGGEVIDLDSIWTEFKVN
jgi:predicted dehydrogenase